MACQKSSSSAMKESLKVPKEHPKPRVRLLDQRDYETLESYDSRCRFVIFCRLPFPSRSVPNLLSHETNPSLNGPDGAHLLYLSTTTKTAAVGGVVEVLLGRHFVESCHSSDG